MNDPRAGQLAQPSDLVVHAAGEHRGMLRHHANAASQASNIEVGQLCATKIDGP